MDVTQYKIILNQVFKFKQKWLNQILISNHFEFLINDLQGGGVIRYCPNSGVVPYFSEIVPLYLIDTHFPKNSQNPVRYRLYLIDTLFLKCFWGHFLRSNRFRSILVKNTDSFIKSVLKIKHSENNFFRAKYLRISTFKFWAQGNLAALCESIYLSQIIIMVFLTKFPEFNFEMFEGFIILNLKFRSRGG